REQASKGVGARHDRPAATGGVKGGGGGTGDDERCERHIGPYLHQAPPVSLERRQAAPVEGDAGDALLELRRRDAAQRGILLERGPRLGVRVFAGLADGPRPLAATKWRPGILAL